jgi:hypothetical protein
MVCEWVECQQTLLGREIVQVNLQGEVVALLGGNDIWAILALQYRLSAIPDKFGETLDGYGDEYLRLSLLGGYVEGNAVEVGDYLVN